MQENEDLATTDELTEEELDDVLDDDEMTIGEFEIESLDTPNGVLELPADGIVEDIDDVDDDLFDDDDTAIVMGGIATVGAETASPLETRVAELEAAARTLAKAEVVRENRKVKRKVSAATTGAGAVGLMPVLLQLVGAIDLNPELAATASAVASLVGAFAAGWLTPERTPPLPSASAHSVLKLGQTDV
jgi:hypothetical protein